MATYRRSGGNLQSKIRNLQWYQASPDLETQEAAANRTGARVGAQLAPRQGLERRMPGGRRQQRQHPPPAPKSPEAEAGKARERGLTSRWNRVGDAGGLEEHHRPASQTHQHEGHDLAAPEAR